MSEKYNYVPENNEDEVHASCFSEEEEREQMSFFETMNNGYQKEYFENLEEKNARRRHKAEKSEIDLIIDYIRFETARKNTEAGYRGICGTGVHDRVVYYKSLLTKELTQEEISFTIAALGIAPGLNPVPVKEAMNKYGISRERYENLCRIYTEVAKHTQGLWKRWSWF